MNKKLFSAALFGALLLGTASTFVSCKDYDDDIKNLQTQITANKDAITQLQALVGSGNWVSSINSIENGFVVNMSNGQSVTVTGINGKDGANGVDGKNGTEWTIGEDGMWYKDGVVTEFKAVATDGKDGAAGAAGVTAPSPKIDENGMWVVYEYDAEAGKFVEKTTTVSAQGTAAYAVTANGVITLHIADETGKYQEIVLPASSDSFVISAPAALVKVYFVQGKWAAKAKNTTKAQQALLAALTKAFPEIDDFEEDSLMTQGGKLPVLVNPSNVKLTNDFTYALVDVEGNVAKATLSDPEEGLPEGTTMNRGTMETRAADAKDCLWTLNVTLEKNKNGLYDSFKTPHALVVENANGTVVKTPFAYTVLAEDEVQSVQINRTGGTFLPVVANPTVPFAEEIDVLAEVYPTISGTETVDAALFVIENGMTGKYVLSVENAADADRYGVIVEGSKLKITNYPAGSSSITIKDVKLIALGLNGSTAEKKIDLTVERSLIPNATPLSAPAVTLSTTGTTPSNVVRWDFAGLGFSASQMQDLWSALHTGYNITRAADAPMKNNVEITYTVKGATTKTVKNFELKPYDANKEVLHPSTYSAEDYKKIATLGFEFNSSELLPNEFTEDGYKVVVSIGTKYVAETTMTISNPENTLVGKDNVVDNEIIVLTKGADFSERGFVTYNLANAFKTGKYSCLDFEDMDRENDEDSWIESGTTLKVYKNNVKDNDNVTRHDIGVERKIKASYILFDNTNNKVEKEFKVKVVSEVYDAEHANVKIDNALTSFYFSGITGLASTAKTSIDLTAAIKATLAAGEDKGAALKLFASSTTTTGATTKNYTKPYITSGVCDVTSGIVGSDDAASLLTTDGKSYVQITEQVYVNAISGDLNTSGTKSYLTTKAWETIWNKVKTYYNTDGTPNATAPETVAGADQVYVNIFNDYKGKIKFDSTTAANTTTTTPADNRVESVLFTFTDQDKAENFLSLPSVTPSSDGVKYYGITSISAKSLTSLTGSEASTASHTVEVNALIKDKWGMTMKVPFTLTIKTSK